MERCVTEVMNTKGAWLEMSKLKKVTNVLALMLMVAVISLCLAGCKSTDEHPSGEHPKGEHSTSEHPASEHPASEHPE